MSGASDHEDRREQQARGDHQRQRRRARAPVEVARDDERRADAEVVEDAEQADRERRQREEAEVGRHEDPREHDRRGQAQPLVARVGEDRDRYRAAGLALHQESASAASTMKPLGLARGSARATAPASASYARVDARRRAARARGTRTRSPPRTRPRHRARTGARARRRTPPPARRRSAPRRSAPARAPPRSGRAGRPPTRPSAARSRRPRRARRRGASVSSRPRSSIASAIPSSAASFVERRVHLRLRGPHLHEPRVEAVVAAQDRERAVRDLDALRGGHPPEVEHARSRGRRSLDRLERLLLRRRRVDRPLEHRIDRGRQRDVVAQRVRAPRHRGAVAARRVEPEPPVVQPHRRGPRAAQAALTRQQRAAGSGRPCRASSP